MSCRGASILVFSCTFRPRYTRHQTSHIRRASWADTLHKRDKILRSRSALEVNDKSIPLSQKYFQTREDWISLGVSCLLPNPQRLDSSCLSKQEFYDSPVFVVISNERWKNGTKQSANWISCHVAHQKRFTENLRPAAEAWLRTQHASPYAEYFISNSRHCWKAERVHDEKQAQPRNTLRRPGWQGRECPT